MRSTITVVVDDHTWDWMQNADGTWMGPLEGDERMTAEEVWEQIRKVIAGELTS